MKVAGYNFWCNWNVSYTWYSWLSCYNGYWKSICFIRSWFSILLFALQKFGSGENFIHWIKVLLNKQQSCVINEGFTTQYFNLEKGARQGDPISAYLFILALWVLFELIKNNNDIRGVTTFNHAFLYTAFANDSHHQNFRCSFFIQQHSQITKQFLWYSKKYTTSASFLEQENTLIRRKDNYL